jgi:hypothetical protein
LNFVWKIVRAGVHDQLWQKSFGKGMWKISFWFSVVSSTEVLGNTLKHTGQTFIPLIPIMATRNHAELVSKITTLEQRGEIAIRP